VGRLNRPAEPLPLLNEPANKKRKVGLVEPANTVCSSVAHDIDSNSFQNSNLCGRQNQPQRHIFVKHSNTVGHRTDFASS
jgi:hypothetical protein